MAETDEVKEPNPLEFWVAYRKDSAGKFHYMGDGNGNIRLFKSEQSINDYLDANMSPEKRAEVFVHSVQGLIAIPEAEQQAGAVVPIRTIFPDYPPTAQELLENLRRRRGEK